MSSPDEGSLDFVLEHYFKQPGCNDEASLLDAVDDAGDLSKITLCPNGPKDELTGSNESTGGLRTRYQTFGEIARGGMGVVLHARDGKLGRDLAMKVLRENHSQTKGMVRRFVEEAQICGQRQHPSIVPVYDLGKLDDERPFHDEADRGADAREAPGRTEDPGRRPWPLRNDLRARLPGDGLCACARSHPP